MKRSRLIIAILFCCCFSCSGKNSAEKDNLSAKTNKSDHRTSNIILPTDSDSINMDIASVKADEYHFDGDSVSWVKKNLIGCWLVPHAAHIQIVFEDNGNFEFNDFNGNLGRGEILKGIFDVNAKDQILTLLYNDKPKQSFAFKPGEYPDENYYISSASGYYFVKTACKQL